MTALGFRVDGVPAPQGSKRAFVVNGRAVMTESSKKVKPWRQDVVAAAKEAAEAAGWVTEVGPVRVAVTFILPRPKYHYRTGKRAHELRDDAPVYVGKKPDVDKLVRSTLDALTTAGVLRDDAQVAVLDARKVYAIGDMALGAAVQVSALAEEVPS